MKDEGQEKNLVLGDFGHEVGELNRLLPNVEFFKVEGEFRRRAAN